MLFQGSAHVGSNEHFELIQRAGGTLNGSTWVDRTNYYETIPSNQLGLALWLEADRMGQLLPAMTQQKLDTQRDVVKNERRWSVDNQPYGTAWEKLQEIGFPPGHPFHHSIIGSMEDLSAASLDDIASFFATYYTPDNAVLSIAGDVDLATARPMVEQYFGAIPRGTGRPPLRPMDVSPRFESPRREIVPDDVRLPRLYLAFRTPVFGSPEYYVASVCGAVLGLRRGSRLHQTLVRERQIAADATAYTSDLAKGSDIMVADVTARPGIGAEQLEEEVLRVVDQLRDNGVTEAEVRRAVALIETAYTAALQEAADRADKLSQFATYFGDPGLINEQVPRYRAVTAAQVSAFAREWLSDDNRASLLYVPREPVAARAERE
jgi:predicted Zn-dependent peptidase